jgi:hypothetical protein
MVRILRIFGAMLILLVIVVEFNACKHDPFISDDDFNPIDTMDNPIDTMDNPVDTMDMGIPCNPELVYYSIDIQPLLNSNCAFSGCHDAATAEDGVDLSSYEKVIQTADVRAFDLDGSDLYEVITDNDPDKRMPPDPRLPLNSEQINLIAKWILQGAENLECDPNAGVCETINVSYSMTIAPVLQNTCIGCHSGGAPAGGISLSSHGDVQAVALNGRLVGAVSHDPAYSAMPQGGNKLSDCKIAQIRAWAEDGAPNN